MIRPESAVLCVAFVVFLCRSSDCFSGGNVYDDKVVLYRREAYEIRETIVVHENVSLTIEPGVVMKFAENTSMIVHGALIANGSHSAQITFDSILDDYKHVNFSKYQLDMSSRLVGGNGLNQGRLEVFRGGRWGTVCDDDWDNLDTLAACRGLGFSRGTFTRQFGPGTGPILLDNVACRDADLILADCSHNGVGIHSCGKF